MGIGPVAFRLVGDSEIELLLDPRFHMLTIPLVLLLAPCELRTKICFNFCPAAVSCPICGCRLPENILQIQSCTPFDEEPDYFTMAATGGVDRVGSSPASSSHRTISALPKSAAKKRARWRGPQLARP